MLSPPARLISHLGMQHWSCQAHKMARLLHIFVQLDHLRCDAVCYALPVIQDDDPVTELLHKPKIMAYENYGHTSSLNCAHSFQAFLLKVAVTNGESFIDEEDIRVAVNCDGKGQPHV